MPQNKPYQSFNKRIKEARINNSEKLDLSYSKRKNKKEIPENKFIAFFDKLFNPKDKPLTEIPKEVFKLKNLTAVCI